MTLTEIILLIIASGSFLMSVIVLLKLRKISESKVEIISLPKSIAIEPKPIRLSEPININPDPIIKTPDLVAKTIEAQSTKIEQLEKQISLYKRPTTGVSLKWSPPREDKSAYLLILLNDFPEQIYNITTSVESTYQKCTSIYSQSQNCEPQKSIDIFFLPAIWADNNSEPTIFRDEFIKLWLESKLKPIEITVQYTRTPTINDNYETAKIFFTRDNLTKHLKTSIQTAKTRLTVVQPLKKS